MDPTVKLYVCTSHYNISCPISKDSIMSELSKCDFLLLGQKRNISNWYWCRFDGLISDDMMQSQMVHYWSTYLTFRWAVEWLWLLLSLSVRLSDKVQDAELVFDLPIFSLLFLKISESLWVTVGCLTAVVWCLLSCTSSIFSMFQLHCSEYCF